MGTATTTRSQTGSSAANERSSRVWPARTTNALGRSAPRRSPLPPAGTIPTTDTVPGLRGRGGRAAAGDVGLLDERLEVRLGVLLLHLERVHQLGGEDLLGSGVHLLLAGREPLLGLADREVADHLGELVDVAGLDLLTVVLEPAVPVLGHLAHVVAKHSQHALDGLLADDPAQACLPRVLTRDHDGHVVVKDLDRQVLALLAEHRLELLLLDLAGAVVRVHHVVADLVDDLDELTLDLEVYDFVLHCCVADVVLLGSVAAHNSAAVSLGLQVAVHEVDLLQAAKALADVLGPHVSYSLHGLELGVGGGKDLFQPPELRHDGLDGQLRQAGYPPQDPVATR